MGATLRGGPLYRGPVMLFALKLGSGSSILEGDMVSMICFTEDLNTSRCRGGLLGRRIVYKTPRTLYYSRAAYGF
jgi:hypothetical protein